MSYVNVWLSLTVTNFVLIGVKPFTPCPVRPVTTYAFYDAENMREKIRALMHTLRVAMPEENFLATWNVAASVLSLTTRMYTREKKLHNREESCLQLLLFTV
jgi:hypothetical protein